MCLDTLQTHSQAVTQDDSKLFSSTQWFLVSDVSYLVMSGNHHCYGETQSSEWRQTNLGWSQSGAGPVRHLLPNWHWDKSPGTEIKWMSSHHCHSKLFARWAKAAIIIKKETEIYLYFAIKIKFSIYIRFFSDVLIVCKFKNTSFWCTQVQTDYIKDWMYINQSLVSSVSISSSYESCGGCVVKWTSVATNINDRH